MRMQLSRLSSRLKVLPDEADDVGQDRPHFHCGLHGDTLSARSREALSAATDRLGACCSATPVLEAADCTWFELEFE